MKVSLVNLFGHVFFENIRDVGGGTLTKFMLKSILAYLFCSKHQLRIFVIPFLKSLDFKERRFMRVC